MERVIIVLSLQIILGGNMFGLVISLLIIALVVIIKNIRIMNNNLTRFCLKFREWFNIQSIRFDYSVSYLYVFHGVHRFLCMY